MDHFGRLTIGNGTQARFHLAETKLKQMAPSVHCGNDAMTLHIPGPRMPHFLVDGGEGSPVPLSEMPASCGFSVKRARRDVSFVAPYHGCNVRKQGGSYVLPLIIMGAPVQMSCPETLPLPTVSCFPSGMVISLGARADTVKIKVDGSWQPLLLTYSQCEFTLDTTGGSLVVTAPYTGSCWEIKQPQFPHPIPFFDPDYFYHRGGEPVPQQPDWYQMFPFIPAVTPAPTTTTTSTPVSTTAAMNAEPVPYPGYPQMYQWLMFHGPKPMKPFFPAKYTSIS
ncbi:uncharacterized protein LOC127637219 [Xyrauchen texanus]|uniref:uncharacterized protein LOC127637219 n=1 Tax=Xyrauchen texanus TaxID=154827 RepID=UPI00224209B3|nr:uncharacterized protein LOC127637219 [Xyrauchen texanus]